MRGFNNLRRCRCSDMINLRMAEILPLVLGAMCFGCFVWGTVKHFVWEGRGSRGAWAVSMLSWVAFLTFVVEMLRRGPTRWWLPGLGMFVFALLLWAWTLRTTRRAPPTLAFTGDRPTLLFREGPYHWVRHPFYTAYLTFWAGGLVVDGSPASALCVAVIGCIYAAAATHEERKFSSSSLAGSYRDYAASTGMFLPKLGGRGALAG